MKRKSFVTSKNKSRAKRGFTLIEILVALAVFLMVIMVVTSIYNLSQKSYKANSNMTEITQNGRIALDRMTREIRQAQEIVTPLADDEIGATNTIEFEDGHTPFSSYQDINSDHFYIRYYIPNPNEEIKQINRQYRVYCFENCSDCNEYYRWNRTREASPTTTHACVLEDKVVAEYISNLEIWGAPLVNIFLNLGKDNEKIKLKTKIFGRNL